MPDMPRPRLHGMFGYASLKALQDALYERSLDRAWKALKEAFGPTEEEAEEFIHRCVAEHVAREAKAAARRAKEGKPPARRRPR